MNYYTTPRTTCSYRPLCIFVQWNPTSRRNCRASVWTELRLLRIEFTMVVAVAVYFSSALRRYNNSPSQLIWYNKSFAVFLPSSRNALSYIQHLLFGIQCTQCITIMWSCALDLSFASMERYLQLYCIIYLLLLLWILVSTRPCLGRVASSICEEIVLGIMFEIVLHISSSLRSNINGCIDICFCVPNHLS